MAADCQNSTCVLLLSFVLYPYFCSFNPPLTAMLQRYMKCLADRFQLKFREGKTKRKSHRTFVFSKQLGLPCVCLKSFPSFFVIFFIYFANIKVIFIIPTRFCNTMRPPVCIKYIPTFFCIVF